MGRCTPDLTPITRWPACFHSACLRVRFFKSPRSNAWDGDSIAVSPPIAVARARFRSGAHGRRPSRNTSRKGHMPENAPSVDLSVVIATYNRASQLRPLLDALLQQDARGVNYEVLVVDNNSRDDT